MPSANDSGAMLRRICIAEAPAGAIEEVRQLLQERGFQVDVAGAASSPGLAAPRQEPNPERRDPAGLEEMSLEQVERLLIHRSLLRHAGNVSRTAQALGLSRSALYRRLHHFGLQPEGARAGDVRLTRRPA
jgi:DNA-binding NtrC family response regulator